MCPACVASAAWIAGGVISTSSIGALAVKLGRGRKTKENDNSNVADRRDVDGNIERNRERSND